MRVYKYTNLEYCNPWSFRLGTLYDYRREEEYGNAVGDKNEGSYHLKYETHFETTDAFTDNLQKNQPFPFMYVKGSNEDRWFYALTSLNLLVFSAVLVKNDEMYKEFKNTNCCVAIYDFYSFSENLVRQIKLPVVKWQINKCEYGPKNLSNTHGPVPSLPFLKNEHYKYQNEVRLCIEVASESVNPLILPGKGFWKNCKIIQSL